jgi:general secretion pathway protein D
VGDTIPFLTGSGLTSGGVSTSNVQREDVALELAVKPQITEGNNVRLTIKQKIEDFSDATNPLEATAGPATSIREIESEVVVPDQRTVVLGGLMQDRDSSRKTKIPLLGDIPILGYLFKGTSHTERKVNLLMFLTPNIIREPQDFLAMLKKKIEQRNLFIDEHFGEKGRNRLRETIKRHNAEILEFKTATTPLSQPEFLPTDPLLGTSGADLGVGEPMPPQPAGMAVEGDLSAVAPEPEYSPEPKPRVKQSRKLPKSQRTKQAPTPEFEPEPSATISPAPRIADEPPVTTSDEVGAPASNGTSASVSREEPTTSGTVLPDEIDLAF